MASLLQWDKDASYLFYRLYHNLVPTRLPLLFLELSAHGLPWLVLPLLVYLLKPALSPPTAALLLNFLVITVLDLAVIAAVKPAIRRARPAYNAGIAPISIHVVDQYAFPSGHATRAGFLAAFILHTRSAHPAGLHPALASCLFLQLTLLWAAAVAVSRVALGRHHWLDVACGVVLGVAYVYVWDRFWISDAAATHLRDALRTSWLGAPRIAKAASMLPRSPL